MNHNHGIGVNHGGTGGLSPQSYGWGDGVSDIPPKFDDGTDKKNVKYIAAKVGEEVVDSLSHYSPFCVSG